MIVEEDQKPKDHVQIWSQLVIRKQFLTLNLYDHVQEFTRVYFSNLDMSLLMILLCKWMHWKFSYTKDNVSFLFQ